LNFIIDISDLVYFFLYGKREERKNCENVRSRREKSIIENYGKGREGERRREEK
jgi:hypothetical protein